MKKIIKNTLVFYAVSLLLTGGGIFARSDSLYIPLNVRKAYDEGTRDISGRPGKNYWVNHSSYKLKVSFEPESGKLEGSGAIVFHNSSPDTLDRLVFRLYQDIMRKGNPRDFGVKEEDLTEGVKILFLSVNGDTVDLSPDTDEADRFGTNLIVKLKHSLPSGAEAVVAVQWEISIPRGPSVRMGTYDDGNAFFIGYWYPQLAVYDDIDGWDLYLYTGTQEFYLDPARFDVKITLPNNFLVWATGVLQNPSEVLKNKFVSRMRTAQKSDTVIKIVDSTDIAAGTVTTTYYPKNTWHFIAESAPDFAFTCADNYLWDGVNLKLGDRNVFIQAAYHKKSQDFYEVAEIARKSIKYFSSVLPGVPYPYPEMTVFNGRGGMEYPMIVNDGSAKQRRGTVHLTSHEICHTYFPFYMGTNERKYAFMDEGWATMLPMDFQGEEAEGYDPMARTVRRFVHIAGTEKDVPMYYISTLYGPNERLSYRNSAYNRPGVAYKLLQQYLGEKKFAEVLRKYIEIWHGKHPIPYDFYFLFNRESGENLNWFWKPWFYDYGYPDLGIEKVTEEDEGYSVTVKRYGNLPIPVKLKVEFADSSVFEARRDMGVWKDGKNEVKIPVKTSKNITRVELGGGQIPDVDMRNNEWLKEK